MVYCSLAAVSSRNAASMKRTMLGSSAARRSAGYGARDIHDGMRGAEDDRLERLLTYRACLGLDPVGTQHVLHARADAPVEFRIISRPSSKV